MDKILRVNMKSKAITYEPVPIEYSRTGGRGLVDKILINEVKPTCEPLGENNKLIFTTGFLAGTSVSCANRLSIGAKSPLTGGIKESNSGGTTAYRLASQGIKALIIEALPEDDSLYNLIIENEKCFLEDANEYAGMGTYSFCESILSKYPKSAVSCIGPAGEKLYGSAGIASLSIDGKNLRYCARGGIGAVMGSKRIKGIIITDNSKVHINDPDEFKKLFREYSKIIINMPNLLLYKKYGTPNTSRITNALAALPVNNFNGSKFAGIEEISAETLFHKIESRGGDGKTSQACMPGCIIQCSNVYPDKNGKAIVSPIEYETIGMLGSNLGIADLDEIARMNYMCNDIGVDTIEVGAALGIAMAAGLAEFGDAHAAINMLDEIANGSLLGKILSGGAALTGKVLGMRHVPAVNGQAMAAYDPRGIKGMGVTYAVSPMGADHTYGSTLKVSIDHHKQEGQTEAAKNAQINISKLDSLGICMFAGGALNNQIQLIVDLINAKNGWNMNTDWVNDMATEAIRNEYKFNRMAGYSNANYRIPEAFVKTTSEELTTGFDIGDEALDDLINSWLNT